MENKNTSDSELRLRYAITNEYNRQVAETNQYIDIIESLLSSDDTIQKLESLTCIQSEIVQSKNKWLTVHLSDINAEIEKLKLLNQIGLLHRPSSTPQKLLVSMSDNKLNFLYVRLTENSVFLPKDTDFMSFCYVFGNNERPTDFTRLEWQQNKQLLRELITELRSPDIMISKHRYDLPPYFKDKKGGNISYLPNNKPKKESEQDPLSKKLKEILIKLRQTK